MLAAKGYGAAVCLITWCLQVSHLNRIGFIRNIHDLYGIAIPFNVLAAEGKHDLHLLLYGTAGGGEDHGIRPLAEVVLREDGLHLYLVLRGGG